MSFLSKLLVYISFLTVAFSHNVNSAPVSKPTLNIYTYSGFASPYGLGPKLKVEFEKICNCEVVFISAGNSLTILSKLKLEGKNTQADIAIGLDNNIISEAKKSGLFAPHKLDISNLNIPFNFTDPEFIPFNYGYLALIYNKDNIKKLPTSMDDFINNYSYSFIISDPRVSTPALGLVLWMKELYGDKSSEMWKKLKSRLVTVAPSWGTSYDLFLKGQADFVLAYTTSPPANLHYNNQDNHEALIFDDGNYLHIELAALTHKGDKNPLAHKFLEFMLSPEIQATIPTINWMWPVNLPKKNIDVFHKVSSPKKTITMSSEEILNNRQKWINEWISALYN